MFGKAIRDVKIWIGVAAIGLACVGCSAQQGSSAEAANRTGGAQTFPAGTQLNVGQGVYTMPEIPRSQNGYALTGDQANGQPLSARTVSGVNGQVYVPATP